MNRPGFAGFRFRLGGVEPGRRIGLTLGAVDGARRPEWRGEVVLGADGTVLVDQATVPVPPKIPWSAIYRFRLDAPGTPSFTIADLTRIMLQRNPHPERSI